MLCAALPVPIVIPELVAVRVPSLVKSPPSVRAKLLPEVLSVARVLIVRGTALLNTLAPFMVIVPVLVIITPPVAAKVASHSAPAVRAVAVLYRSVAAAP